jgi:hypothetical protein
VLGLTLRVDPYRRSNDAREQEQLHCAELTAPHVVLVAKSRASSTSRHPNAADHWQGTPATHGTHNSPASQLLGPSAFAMLATSGKHASKHLPSTPAATAHGTG